jgi:hypothetical protein
VAAPPGVEDPISALFDLSERAAGMAPVVRRLYRYTAAILVTWIAIMAVLIIVGLGAAGWLAFLALLGLAAGVIALGLLRQTDRFFREFHQRYRWIQLVRDADPIAKIPEGRTPVERLGRYLTLSNPRVEELLKARPGALRYRVSVRAGGKEIPFDLIIEEPANSVARWSGMGEEGFAVVARSAPDAPTLEDLRRFESEVAAAAPGLEGRVARLILLRTNPVPLPQEVYEYAVGHPIYVPWGFGRHRVTIEIISENPNGTYDFVPHVLGVP